MRIDNLSKRQVKLLDTMWSMDSYEEYQTWKRTLTFADQMMVETLTHLLILADIDEQVEKMEEFPEVMELIEKIK